MNSSSHPRFRLLIGWCCMMSSALLLITVYLSVTQISSKKSDTKDQNNNSAETSAIKGSPFGPSIKNYIRLIRDGDHWICVNPCESSSLSLKNDSVQIKTRGLYYNHAQVSFQKKTSGGKPNLSIVQLRKNGGHGTRERVLSEVNCDRTGSVTMIQLVHLENEESISLNIKNESALLLTDEYHTYWEIILLSGL